MESVAISTNESWDLAELVDLEILRRDTLGRVGVDELQVDVVRLGHSSDGNGARVFLRAKR